MDQMSLRGNLREMSVADLIQHYCDDRKKARLDITSGKQEAQIFFEEGNVVHASLGLKEGEQVIYDVLGWEQGTFSLTVGVKSPKESIKRSWAGLIMEGAKRLDEAKLAQSRGKSKVSIDHERLNKTIEDLQKELGKGLLSADVWQKKTSKQVAGFNSPQKSTILFNEITSYLSSTLAVSEFPPLGGFSLLNLENDQTVVVVDSHELLLVMFIDTTKTTMGLIINLGIPLALKGLVDAIS
jgi:hypothetical protein